MLAEWVMYLIHTKNVMSAVTLRRLGRGGETMSDKKKCSNFEYCGHTEDMGIKFYKTRSGLTCGCCMQEAWDSVHMD